MPRPRRSIGSAKSAQITLPAESRAPRELGAHIHRPGAEVEVRPLRVALEVQRVDRRAAPAAVEIRAQEVVEQIVARRDLREDPAHVRPLRVAAGRRVQRFPVLRRRHCHGAKGVRRARAMQARGAGSPPAAAITCTRRARTVARPAPGAMPAPTSLDLVNLPDADLAALAREGREPAFRELVRRYERPVFSLIFRMVRDRETAEDLAQETFIKILNHIDRYRPEFKFSSWLFKIANNLTIDHLRKRQLKTISIDGSPHAATAAEVEASTFDVEARGESALEEMESKELGGAIEKAIAKLRPEYRACILLRHVEDRSYEEIAATLDLPLGTVKTYIHRARHELREALAGVRS